MAKIESDLPPTMHAWHGSVGGRKPSKVEIPLPELEPDGILVKVLASGVCHSDCFILNGPHGSLPGWKDTFVMGHEGSGVIVKMGSNVTGSSLHIGQDVVVMCTPGCNKTSCGECSRGHQRLCQAGQNPGLGSDGVFGQYVAVKPWGVVPVPPDVPHEIAAVSADAVLTAYHAVKAAANVQSGQTIIIFGIGGVGFNGLQIALHLGASRVIVVDNKTEALEEAIKLGVAREDAICAADGTKVEAKVAQEGIVVDAVIDFVGAAETFTSGQLSVRPAGTLVLVGLYGEQLPLITLPVVVKSIDIRCSYNGTRDELTECLELISRGIVRPRVEVGSIDNLPQVLENLDAGKVKSRMVLLPRT